MKIITASLSQNLQRTLLNTFRYLEKFQVSPPKKEITARHIVTSQSRQRFVFNSKIETKQTRLTEKLNQLQVHMQILKHNMKSDDIKL